MKSCRRVRPLLLPWLQGEMGENERQAVAGHVRDCPDCAAALAEWRALERIVDRNGAEPVPEPDWDASWRRISERLDRPAGGWSWRPQWRWALAGTAMAAVFVVGIFVGRRTFTAPGPLPEGPAAGAMTYEVRDFSDLVPLITEFANAQQRPQGGRLLQMDRDWAGKLLFKYRLLRQRVKDGNDPVLAQFLDDIELILLEISRGKPADAENVETIRELIRQKGISFKLRIYNNNPRLLRRI